MNVLSSEKIADIIICMSMLNKELEKIREQIKHFPQTAGLYFMKDASDKVLYIGKAKNIRARVASYFQPAADLLNSRGPKIVEMTGKVCSIDYLETDGEVDAILKEARLIKDLRPPYNSRLLDDKSFPYLQITVREDFPGVYVTRKPDEKSRLFGPFASAGDVRSLLVVLQKIFRFRTCSLEIKLNDDRRKFFRPCILYNIKQCTAPCAAKIEKAEYKKLIADLINFLNSKRSNILRKLKTQMQSASAAMEYEKAAMLRDRIRLIEKLDDKGLPDEDVQPEVFAADPNEALVKLQKLLGGDNPIRVIEGFDIAHIQGQETVGSLVKFIDGRPFRSGYRRYRIKTVHGIDDCRSLQEVISRRYRHSAEGEELPPDLILIDGGIGQLHAAENALKNISADIPNLISIAKREEVIFIRGRNEPLRLSANDPMRKLLQYVRDEAHRFAQHYHHILRRKKNLGEK